MIIIKIVKIKVKLDRIYIKKKVGKDEKIIKIWKLISWKKKEKIQNKN